jgi:hypothetical protein
MQLTPAGLRRPAPRGSGAGSRLGAANDLVGGCLVDSWSHPNEPDPGHGPTARHRSGPSRGSRMVSGSRRLQSRSSTAGRSRLSSGGRSPAAPARWTRGDTPAVAVPAWPGARCRRRGEARSDGHAIRKGLQWLTMAACRRCPCIRARRPSRSGLRLERPQTGVDGVATTHVDHEAAVPSVLEEP